MRRSLRVDFDELVEREVELEHVHASRRGSRATRPSVLSSMSSLHLRDREPALLGDPRRLQPRVGHRDVRVEARGRRGHRVDRHLGVVGEPVQLAVGLHPLRRPASGSRGSSGPRFEPLLERRVVARPSVDRPRRRRPTAATGSTRERRRPSSSVNAWPISSSRPPSRRRSTIEPFALSWNATCADAGDHERDTRSRGAR